MSSIPPKTLSCPSYTVTVYIAGEFAEIKRQCSTYVDDVELCVTVTAASFVYTGGTEEGAAIGLLRYPRFAGEQFDKKESEEWVWTHAVALANYLLETLYQRSVLVQGPTTTTWFSRHTEEGK